MIKNTFTGVLILAMCCLPRGCWKYNLQREGLAPYIAISPDDREILFSWYKKGRASLYAADVNGENVRQLSTAKKESHIKAVYSHDGSKIIFLAYREKRGRLFSDICVMDADGSNVRKLSSGKQHITEAIFSPDGNAIYYLQSNFFGHYSPIAGSGPHDFDIYSMNIDGTGIRQITNLKRYRMYGLAVTSDGRWLAFADEKYKEINPFHFLDLKNPDNLTSFRPSGRFYSEVPLISYFQLSPNDKFAAFVTKVLKPVRLEPNEVGGFKYELYLMDLKSKFSMQITNMWRNVKSPCFMRNKPRLIFIVDIMWSIGLPKYEIWAVNMDGTDLTKIDLSIAELK